MLENVGVIGVIGLNGATELAIVRADWGVRGWRKVGKCSAPGTDIEDGISPTIGIEN